MVVERVVANVVKVVGRKQADFVRKPLQSAATAGTRGRV